MAGEDASLKIERLRGDNYHSWAQDVEALLTIKGVWNVVEEEPDNPNAPTRANMAKAKALLTLNVDKYLKPIISRADTPHEAWTALRGMHQQSSHAARLQLLEELTKLKKSDGESIVRYVARARKLQNDLAAAGDNTDEESITLRALAGLPKTYAFVRGLVTHGNDAVPPLEELLPKLLITEKQLEADEPTRKSTTLSTKAFYGKGGYGGGKAPSSFPRQDAASGRGFRPPGKYKSTKVRCYECGQLGHIARECPRRNGGGGHRSGYGGKAAVAAGGSAGGNAATNGTSKAMGFALATAAHPTGDAPDHPVEWVMDSGASYHMTGSAETLPVASPLIGGGPMVIYGNGGTATATASSDVPVAPNITLKGVYYVPGLTANLFSISKATDAGADVLFSGDKCYISYAGETLLSGNKRQDGLFSFRSNRATEPTSSALLSSSGGGRSTAELWHRRFAHAGYSTLAKMASMGMVNGLPTPASAFEALTGSCEPCIIGKHARAPFPTSQSKTSKPLELLHMDLCRLPVVSSGGSRYIATVLDDYSGYSEALLTARKSEVAQAMSSAITRMETKTGNPVRRVRTDNGSEYVNETLGSFLEAKGITHETTVPYTPEQNGKAERLNRTLLEKTRTLLTDAGQPLEMWGEAVTYANFTRNLTLYGDRTKTPWELFTGHKPSVDGLRVFGCRAFARVPSDLRHKLEPASMEGTFVGYEPNTKGYRILLPDGQIIVSRDVIFDENARGGSGGAFGRRTTGSSVAPLEPAGGEERPADIPVPTPIPVHQPAAPTPVTQPQVQQSQQQGINDQNEPDNAENPEEQEDAAPVTLRTGRVSAPPRDWWVVGQTSALLTAAPTVPEPKTLKEALSGPHAQQWHTANLEELAAIKANNTYDLVPLPPGAKALDCHFVWKVKRDGSGAIERFKSRLVVGGHRQREGIDYNEVFAPVSKYTSLRALVALTAVEDLELHVLDFTTAFLNGEIEEEVYVHQPLGYPLGPEHLVMKLKRALYGLHQAPRAWHQRLKSELHSLGFSESKADAGLYIYTDAASAETVYALVYVDDILLASKSLPLVEQIKVNLASVFKARDLGEARLFLGITIKRDRKTKTIKLCQERLATDIVSKFGLADSKPRVLPLSLGTQLSKTGGEPLDPKTYPYAEAVGALNYLAHSTRPDLCHSVGILSKYMAHPTSEHWTVLKGVLRYLAGTKGAGITYGGKGASTDIVGYVDASYAEDLDTRRSHTGYVFLMSGGAISWASRQQATVAASTTESEYIAAATAVKEALWLRKLCADLRIGTDAGPCIEIRADNQGAIKLLRNPIASHRTKHIDVAYRFARERVERREVSFTYVSTSDMLADMLTKAVPISKLKMCCEGIGVKV